MKINPKRLVQLGRDAWNQGKDIDTYIKRLRKEMRPFILAGFFDEQLKEQEEREKQEENYTVDDWARDRVDIENRLAADIECEPNQDYYEDVELDADTLVSIYEDSIEQYLEDLANESIYN